MKFENEGVSLPNASADPEKIKQVLYNLVGNAIKFTEKGGITVSVANSDGQIRVTVKDTGLGVSDEYQKCRCPHCLFQPTEVRQVIRLYILFQ